MTSDDYITLWPGLVVDSHSPPHFCNGPFDAGLLHHAARFSGLPSLLSNLLCQGGSDISLPSPFDHFVVQCGGNKHRLDVFFEILPGSSQSVTRWRRQENRKLPSHLLCGQRLTGEMRNQVAPLALRALLLPPIVDQSPGERTGYRKEYHPISRRKLEAEVGQPYGQLVFIVTIDREAVPSALNAGFCLGGALGAAF